jgi:type VI secretion system protein ImpM
MPEAVAGTRGSLLLGAAIGFYGKIPARGDFVQAGLPRSFVDPWDDWLQRVIAASRLILSDSWLPAWLESPVWRFALAPGLCGPAAVVGLWMPSVDRVGRHYPLTLAAVARDAEAPELLRDCVSLLSAAEAVGRDALESDLTPEELAAGLAAGASGPFDIPDANADPGLCPSDGALWWTEGGPRVAPGTFVGTALPDEETFAAMLSQPAGPPALGPEAAR